MTDNVFETVNVAKMQEQIQRERSARLVVLLNAYHSLPDEDARQFQYPSDRALEISDVSAYQRSITISSDNYVELDFGHVEDDMIGTVILVNITKATKDENGLLKPIPNIFVSDYNLIVPPGNPTIFYPMVFRKICVKAEFGQARLTYVGIPK